MIITCPNCFTADDVTYLKASDGGYLYTWTRTNKHEPIGDWMWIADPKDPTLESQGWPDGGVTGDLMDPFEHILRGLPHQWIEYGVLEYELRRQYPDLFGAHVAEAGHVILKAAKSTASSVRFVTALGRLGRAGIVRSRIGAATGAWSYNSQVTHWMLEDAVATAPTLT